MKKLALAVLVVGSAFIASCTNYATKEYVDAEISKVNDRVLLVEAKLSALEKEIISLKGQSGSVAGISERVANLESRINQMKNICPSACSDRINALEKEVAGLKDKVEKQTKVMEKEVEKSMQK